MSNYNTQLQSNNIDIQTVLQTLQTKAVGGSIGTCTVTVNHEGMHDFLFVYATVLDDNGAVKAEEIVIPKNESKEIQCLCGSLFGFEYSMNDNWDITDNMTDLDYNNDCALYQAPTTPGDVATVNVYFGAGDGD